MKIFVWGLCGKMGKVLESTALQQKIEVAGGFDKVLHNTLPCFDDTAKINVDFDVIIDFSSPHALDDIINVARAKKVPVVLATTGYSQEQEKKILELSKIVPVLKSGNMSQGIAVLSALVSKAAQLLSDFDIEIVEKHHNQKQDAPSGTALLLSDACGEHELCMGRSGKQPRKKGEIGIHAVRGGTIFGEHSVIFAGNDEVITLSHTALSKAIFAEGALKAAQKLANLPCGLYTLSSIYE